MTAETKEQSESRDLPSRALSSRLLPDLCLRPALGGVGVEGGVTEVSAACGRPSSSASQPSSVSSVIFLIRPLKTDTKHSTQLQGLLAGSPHTHPSRTGSL